MPQRPRGVEVEHVDEVRHRRHSEVLPRGESPEERMHDLLEQFTA